MSTTQKQVKWGKVMLLLDKLYELYYSNRGTEELLDEFAHKVEELMEAYNEWLG